MILPIYSYGHSILKRVAEEIKPDHPGLAQLVADMWETMYQAKGVGLAAPQVGLGIRLFIVDTEQMDEEKSPEGIKKVFINPAKIEENGEAWSYEEGCLSIPKITGDIERPDRITLSYCDEDFNVRTDTFTGLNARVIQHEYDHLEGILFTDRLKPLKRRLIKRKLDAIKKGNVEVSYKMKFRG